MPKRALTPTLLGMSTYLPEFFTPDRLKWYRDLTERFPLWCGNWPKDLLWHPKAQEWSLDVLSRMEFEEEGAEEPIIFIEFHESPTTESVSPPYLVLYESDTMEGPEDDPYTREYGIDPVVFGALFAAINYLSYGWEDEILPHNPTVAGSSPAGPTSDKPWNGQRHATARLQTTDGGKQIPASFG